MIGAIISAAQSVAGSIAGGIMGAKRARNQKRIIRKQEELEDTWYNNVYGRDDTQMADFQRIKTQVDDRIKNRMKAARGTQAVMGGTTDSVQAELEGQNNLRAEMMSQQAAQAAQSKREIQNQHMKNQQAFLNERKNIEQQKKEAIRGAVGGILSGSSAIADSVSKTGEDYKGVAANTNSEAYKVNQSAQKALDNEMAANRSAMDTRMNSYLGTSDINDENYVDNGTDEYGNKITG